MSGADIRTEAVPWCPACEETDHRILYAGMQDRLFGTPGEWTLKKCLSCGTAFLDPRPTPEDVGKAYADYYTHSAPSSPKGNSSIHRFYRDLKSGYLGRRWGYRSGLKSWQMTLSPLLYLHPGRRAQLDHTVMYSKAMPGGRLMDVGCGSGELIERLKNLGWQVEGVDFDATAVRTARRRDLKVHLGTLEDQSYPEASFDAVTMSHVIEHVHDPSALLRECHRILKPGGCLVMVTPNISSMGHKRFGTHWRGLEPPRHLHIFTPLSLRHLAEEAGFEHSSVRTTMQAADFMYMASNSIWRKGSYSEKAPKPLIERLRGRWMQYLEWAILKMRSDVGEETVAVVEKQ